MKKVTKLKSLITAFLTITLLLQFCSCGGTRSPKERLPDEVKEYISTNYRGGMGVYVSEPVNVDVASIVELKSNEWTVLGTYTIKLGNEILSAKFGLVASYDEKTDKFTFSKEEFDDFK